MIKTNNYKYLLEDISKIKGIGKKTAEIFKRKKIYKIFDLLWRLPQSYVDRSYTSKINELQIGKIQTIKVKVLKYNFPRIKNLPNIIVCEDVTGKIDCVFFNSYEGYIKKILPLNKTVTISGKITLFRDKYQITNPKYISEDGSLIKKKHNKYSLSEGISEKVYNKIITQVLNNLPYFPEWHNENILNLSWNLSIKKLHDPKNIGKN